MRFSAVVRTGLTAALVVGAIWALYVSAARLRSAHDDLAERAWLSKHAPVREYRVLELGEQRLDGSATSVWVAVPGSPQAFVDLRGSAERVDRPGQTLRARIDTRQAPATGEGYAPDNADRAAFRAYLSAAWPAILGMLLLIGGLWAVRRRWPDARW
jgi:hypothetical protein